MVHERPDRILAIYIRSVRLDPGRIAGIQNLAAEVAGMGAMAPELLLVDDTVTAARHAAGRGWIDPATLPYIARKRDQER